MGVINGILMQETFREAALDDVSMVRQVTRARSVHMAKMKKLFLAANRSKDGSLTRCQLRRLKISLGLVRGFYTN